MTDRLAIEMLGEQDLLARIDHAVRKLGHPQVLFTMIGAQLETNIQRRFDTKVAPDGTPWLPLADSTKARYAKLYKGSVPGSLLERTRQMRDSLAANATADAVEVGFSRLTPGGAWNLAALHELGTRHMPRRQMLTDDPIAGTLGREDREDIQHLLQGFLDALL
jgi:phage virion morphogenesis protein